MRYVALRWVYFLSLMSLLSLLASCSLFSSRSQVSESLEKKKLSSTPVSRKQYDGLLSKYDALTKRMRQLEADDDSIIVKAKPSFNEKKNFDKATDLITKLNSSEQKRPQLIETVDVFAGPDRQLDPEKIQKSIPKKRNRLVTASPRTGDIQIEINHLMQAKKFLMRNKLDAALQIFKELELSKHRQVKVRARFFIGEVLFKQGEYDLAMQVFEEIINKFSFSGIILKTLGRLVVCSDKLKLKKKYDLYYSILHDFFETT